MYNDWLFCFKVPRSKNVCGLKSSKADGNSLSSSVNILLEADNVLLGRDGWEDRLPHAPSITTLYIEVPSRNRSLCRSSLILLSLSPRYLLQMIIRLYGCPVVHRPNVKLFVSLLRLLGFTSHFLDELSDWNVPTDGAEWKYNDSHFDRNCLFAF